MCSVSAWLSTSHHVARELRLVNLVLLARAIARLQRKYGASRTFNAAHQIGLKTGGALLPADSPAGTLQQSSDVEFV